MFQYSAITSNGLAALSGSITDDNILKVTRIEYGDGIIEDLKTATTASAILEIIRNQTSLVNKKCDLSVYKIEKQESSDVRTIVGVVQAASVSEDFNAREAAIYAEYNGQEILFAYFTAVAFIDGEKTDTSNYISKIALSVKPCYFVTNISMANSTEIDYIFDADLSLPTITPTEIEGGYLLEIKDSLGVKNVEIKNRHLAGEGLKEEGDYLTAPVATQTSNGIMTSTDKFKLDGIATGANKYILPKATATTLGGVIVGAGLSVSDGKVSAPVVTQSANGIMIAADKTKLDGLSSTILICSTSKSTTSKTTELNGFTLKSGAVVRVLFQNGNTVAKPTLNLSSTGAKEIRVLRDGKALSITSKYGSINSGAYTWQSNTILDLMYNGTYWIIIGNSTDSQVPTGTIVGGLYADAPAGYLLCNGAEVSISDYQSLYNVIGSLKICKSNTSGMFKLPDLRDRFLQGANNNLGSIIDAGLPNLTGNLGMIDSGGSGGLSADLKDSPSGVFSKTTYKDAESSCNGSGGKRYNVIFSADSSNPVYGNSDTVQPPALTVNYIIKY